MPSVHSTANACRGLIAVLADSGSNDRQDAAMDLGAFDDPEAEAALLAVALNHAEDPNIADAAGESLREIWLRNGMDVSGLAASMHPEARKFFLP